MLDRDLRVAVERDQLRLRYQPIAELSTGRIAGVEALLRCHHPERGLQRPASFIEAAEDCVAIVGIGRWVLEQSCRQAARWLEELSPSESFSVAVDLSRRQLLEPDIVDVVRACIEDAGISAARLVLEVAESALFADTDQLVARLEALKDLGALIAMDDFGTGHSTLLQLRRLPIDIVKIDQSSAAHIDDQREDYALAAAVVRLTTGLGKSTVAEGVDEPGQFAHVRALGVDCAQGHLSLNRSIRPPSPTC